MARHAGRGRRKLAEIHAPGPQLRGAREVAVRLTEDEFERLLAAARRRGTSLPNYLRKAGLAVAKHDEILGGGVALKAVCDRQHKTARPGLATGAGARRAPRS